MCIVGVVIYRNREGNFPDGRGDVELGLVSFRNGDGPTESPYISRIPSQFHMSSLPVLVVTLQLSGWLVSNVASALLLEGSWFSLGRRITQLTKYILTNVIILGLLKYSWHLLTYKHGINDLLFSDISHTSLIVGTWWFPVQHMEIPPVTRIYIQTQHQYTWYKNKIYSLIII